MDRIDILIEDKIKEYRERNTGKSRGDRFNELPIFEFKYDHVLVEILNEGTEYYGEERFKISYKDFNNYISKGMSQGVGWGSLIQDQGGRGGHVRFTPDTVGWKKKSDGYYLVEKMGGSGFPVFKIDGKDSDYGTIYITETYVGEDRGILERNEEKQNERIDQQIEVKTVKRFTGFIYMKGTEELEDIPLLTELINENIKGKALRRQDYFKYGMSEYFYLNNQEDKYMGIKEELERSREEKNKVIWGNIL